MSAIKQDIVDLKDSIRKSLSIGAEGVASLSDPKALEQNLPEGITAESFKAHNAHRDNVVSAMTMAVGEAAKDYLDENKDVAEVRLDSKFFGDKVSARVMRETESRNPTTGEKKPVLGASRFSYTVAGTKSAQMKNVQNHIKGVFGNI